MGVCVLVTGGGGEEEGEEGTLLPAAVALMLRLRPTLPQICCAKAMTSAEKGSRVSQIVTFRKIFRASLLFGGMLAPVICTFPPFPVDHEDVGAGEERS